MIGFMIFTVKLLLFLHQRRRRIWRAAEDAMKADERAATGSQERRLEKKEIPVEVLTDNGPETSEPETQKRKTAVQMATKAKPTRVDRKERKENIFR